MLMHVLFSIINYICREIKSQLRNIKLNAGIKFTDTKPPGQGSGGRQNFCEVDVMKKGIVSVVLVGMALRLAVLAGAGEALSQWAKKVTQDGSLITATLRLELGKGGEEPENAAIPPEITPETGEKAFNTVQVAVTAAPSPSPAPEPEESEEPEIIAADMSADAEIKNDTSFEIDLMALAAEGLSLRLEKDEPQILIIHTHSSEAYAQDEFDRYEPSDVSRTEDKSYNIIRVGDELAEKLEESGLNVIHDREIYDYPSYTGSYTRSGEAIERYLDENPGISIVIDLHRDALGSGDTVYKTKAELDGKSCAQVMLLVGTGENGLWHPNWRENLKLALYMQNAADAKYPTLMRPIALKPERYNQQLTTGSMIIEVGSSGNTLSEALLAIDLFAESVGPALAELISDK